MSVIDIHTHMFGYDWLDMLKKHGAPNYASASMEDGRNYLMEMGSPACAFEEEAFDYDKRIKMMDNSGIDENIISKNEDSKKYNSTIRKTRNVVRI